jgi:hypothetical protein
MVLRQGRCTVKSIEILSHSHAIELSFHRRFMHSLRMRLWFCIGQRSACRNHHDHGKNSSSIDRSGLPRFLYIDHHTQIVLYSGSSRKPPNNLYAIVVCEEDRDAFYRVRIRPQGMTLLSVHITSEPRISHA